MKSDNINKWIYELRSNKFHKCKKYLRYNNTYCALGILCEISGLGEWVEDISEAGVKNYKINGSKGHRKLFFPPNEVYDWIGLKKEDRRIFGAYVSSLNDQDLSFKEIASFLESKIKKE